MRQAISVFGLLCIAAWASLATAQVTTGSISGTVTDSSGAVLPGVKIELMNEGTGTIRTVSTNSAGRYSAPTLAVGSYRVTGTLEGFQTEVRNGIGLTIGREAIVDMKLQVGAVSQSVEVTGEAPLVQTTEATVSYLVADQTMRDLPLNNRDMSQLILLNPGVTETENPGSQAFNGYGRRLSISGARGEDNTYLMDGGMIGDFRRHIPAGPSGALLGVESTQEFQVLTNSYSAQYGRSLGGVFNSISKSGTNSFHGDVYEFLRNDKFDAKKWETNIITPSSSAVKPPLRRNQFGGTLGGPIKKDKIFFFASYEGTRERLGSNKTPTVLDDNARNGILPSKSGGTYQIAVSPLMQPYINWYPHSTPGAPANGDGTAPFLWTYSQPTTEDYAQGRIDLPNLTSKDSLFFRYTSSISSRDSSPGNGLPGYIQTDSLSSKLMTLSTTRIITPTLLNSVRIHFNRVVPKDDGREPAKCSVSNVIACTPDGVFFTPGQADSPSIGPGNGIGGSNGLTTIGGGGYATKPTIMTSNRFTYQDDATWTKGGHQIQFGGQLERFQLNTSKPNRASGVWTWTSIQQFLAGTCDNLTNNNVANGANGVSLASVPSQCNGNTNSPIITTENSYRGAPPSEVLAGVQSVVNLIGGTIPDGFDTFRRGFRQWTVGMYVQDNWRFSKKLTLNIGLRYEPYTVPYEIHNWLANLRDIYNNSVASIGNPYWHGSSKKDFSPRFGFAYDPFGNGNTSIRGGFGLLFEPNDPNLFYNQMDRMPPLAFDFSLTGNGHFPFSLNEIGAQPTLGPAFATGLNNRSPHMLQYNFSIQRQIGGSDLVSVGYAGSRGLDLVGLAQANTPFAQYDGQALAVPTSTVQTIAGVGTVNNNYSDINLFIPAYNSWYNSLQVTYVRRFSKGLQTQIAYTWQKNLSDSDTAQTANEVSTGSTAGLYTWDRKVQKSLSGYDIKNTLKVNYSWDVPAFKGAKGLVGKILGGWQTSGVLTMHAGHPFGVTAGIPTALSNLRVLSRLPNTNSNFTGPLYYGSPSDATVANQACPTAQTCFQPYFNINAWNIATCDNTNSVATAFGNVGPNCLGPRELGNGGRYTLVGPGLIQWDPAVLKNFAISERTKLQFRAEFFNILNRPNFSTPSSLSLVSSTGQASNTAGRITTTIGSSRNVQFGLKLTF